MITRGVFVAGMAAMAMWAQEGQPVGIAMAFPPQGAVTGAVQGPVHVPGSPGQGPIMFIRTEMAGADKLVKGVPYSADVVTEFTQTLADGNAIRRNQTGTVARDSEGRTRREQPMAPLGPIAMSLPAAHLVFINDPVAGFTYVLDTDRKTAQKLPMPKTDMAAKQAAEAGMTFEAEVISGEAAGPATATMAVPAGVRHMTYQQVHVDASGEEGRDETRTIEGVRTLGRKTTHTIPAGEVGNDRPIETVSERWYSPELETLVMSRNNDPRMGETVYRLTNINRSEPSPSLFEIPADYKITEGPMRDVKYKMEKRLEGTPTK